MLFWYNSILCHRNCGEANIILGRKNGLKYGVDQIMVVPLRTCIKKFFGHQRVLLMVELKKAYFIKSLLHVVAVLSPSLLKIQEFSYSKGFFFGKIQWVFRSMKSLAEMSKISI